MLTTTYVPGAPNWLDLGSPDLETSRTFYAAVLGWEFRSAGPEGGGYGFFTSDGKTVAGLGPLDKGARPAWTVYFHTADADATAKAVESAGGRVRVAPKDVFSHGRMAAFTDPTGAEFAVWQPKETGGLEAVAVPGSLAWTELYTTDAKAAKDFYRAVFSWQMDDKEMGEGLTYALLRPSGGGPGTEHGGLMQLLPVNLEAGSTPEWHPYFEVADCDAAATKAVDDGAATLIPPTNAPGIGRFAMFLDPVDALFAVLQSDRRGQGGQTGQTGR
ncbi:VOC family protein [Streptomyces beihaiensis]|uniref:VOC family protein n=1 Tax=Streptomyces beihaiensis TaxID=2984495 RepID=A0ABT3TZX7_9ACTN|nr:VOC family protein [Streptomyces beihaiensis]MCX3061528.1 VOC family protein [Streptomyces beihaiensis]